VKTKPLWLTRTTDGKPARDLVTFALPSLPRRLDVNDARRTALGFRENEDRPSQPAAIGDMLCLQWAALGLCSPSGLVGVALPDFREHGRDVVLYGEAVASALWDAGYREIKEQTDAGLELLTWMGDETFGDEKRAAVEAKGFPSAPEPETGPGAH
jgi:hypothetical protein